MISRISMALFFLCFALTTLFHVAVGALIMSILAFIAAIALIAGQ